MIDAELQQRNQMGLNKGESHHALKRAISFNRRGEIRDRSSEGQHYRIAGMNLIAAIIIYWNTKKLGEIVEQMVASGNPPDPTSRSAFAIFRQSVFTPLIQPRCTRPFDRWSPQSSRKN